MSSHEASRARLASNPFYVLDLPHDCSRVEVERQGKKLLAMLEIDIGDAASYATPFGPRQRTPELIRESMAILRDPQKRLAAEMWARASVAEAAPDATDTPKQKNELPHWPDALHALGWSRR